MKHDFTLLAALCGGALLTACRDAPTYAGTVCLRLEHHGAAVPYATVYHAPGVRDFPGYTDDMDALYPECRELGASSTVCFDELRLGLHWFVAKGYDAMVADSVLGSLSLALTTRASRIDTVLSVSESH